jgi:lipopolysaccharide export system protein LptA
MSLFPVQSFLLLSILIGGGIVTARPSAIAQAMEPDNAIKQPMTLRADIQQANSITGVVTALGNVQIDYPARQIQATSAQAQYFSRERRIVLTGNVYVLQQGNSLRADNVTYLIDENRFVALPMEDRQVESIILIPETPEDDSTTGSKAFP